jgi:inositol 2-dehydrogenase
MQFAVIGLGRMGRFYAQTIAALGPTATLTAVVDPDPLARAAVQSQLGVPHAFAEADAVFDLPSQIDAIVIATPTSTHASLVVAAARAGKAIFCEKPLALSLEQTHAALGAVEHARVLLQVGFMRRFDPAYLQARALIEDGRIGRPVTFKAIGRDPDRPPLAYANPAQSGGLILDMGIHDFDLARWLMSSEVERVTAEGALLVYDDLKTVGDIDNAIINMRFENGALGNVEISRNARYGYDVRTEVLGSDGALIVGGHADDGQHGVLALTSAPQDGETPHFVKRFGAAYKAEIEHFIDCVTHDRMPAVGGADALAAFEIGLAATRAWQTGRPVTLAEVRA